tara:strand:+ start:2365 stop:2571 length:207 start_codon:yes stop_codon:yes gene_type:complete
MYKVKSFTYKEKDVYVGQQKDKFFNVDDYDKEHDIFKKETNAKVVDFYIKGIRGNQVLLTLVNYKRED